jgi:putative SOS response-associated peptidase YedK
VNRGAKKELEHGVVRKSRSVHRVFEHWHRGDQDIDSATIITTEPNELMEGIHDRMPVILSPDDYDLWLEPEFHGQGKLLEMLKPYPAEEMGAYPVSTVVNNPRNEKKECIEAFS